MYHSLKESISSLVDTGIILLKDDSLSSKAINDGETILVSGLNSRDTLELCKSLFARLRYACDLNLLDQIPQQAAEKVQTNLNSLVNNFKQVIAGQLPFRNVADAIRVLHYDLWSWNLMIYLDSSEDQVSNNFFKLKNIVEVLEALNKRADEVVQSLEILKNSKDSVQLFLKSIEEILESSQKLLSAIESDKNNVQAYRNSVEVLLQETKEIAGQAREAMSTINTNKTKIVEFFEEIDVNEQKLKSIIKDSTDTVTINTEKTQKIITSNESLQKSIDDILQKAIGASLFSAFDQRRKILRNGKLFWLFLTIISCYFLMVLLGNLADGASAVNIIDLKLIHLLKLMSTPLVIWVIYFCSSHYSKEREYEEQYAFKSAKSLSLEPYRRLIGDLALSETKDKEREFVERALDGIFEDLPSLRPDIVSEKIRKSELRGITEPIKELAEVFNMVGSKKE